jgi:hypothetical protein
MEVFILKLIKINYTHIPFIILIIAISYWLFSYVSDSYNAIRYGSGTYYINLFPEDSKSKNYRIKGKVEYEGDSQEYFLVKATFPNGGYITFDGSYGDSPLEFYKKVYIEDDDGKGWYVELTKEKVKEE